MFERIEMMNMARAMIDHATRRNTIVARNVANADTPNFRARDLEAFNESYSLDTPSTMRITRAGHIPMSRGDRNAREIISGENYSPNGNSVSLEDEMVKIAELKHQYDKSLGIYKSTIDLMRISIGNRA